jgi:Zn-dependent M16 (insulinase) family peptidase
VQVAAEDYVRGANYLSRLLYNVHIDTERVNVVAQQLLNSIAEMKRDGDSVAHMLSTLLTFDRHAPHNVHNLLRHERYLTQLLHQLKTNPDEVVRRLQSVFTSVVMSPLRYHTSQLTFSKIYPIDRVSCATCLHAFGQT